MRPLSTTCASSPQPGSLLHGLLCGGMLANLFIIWYFPFLPSLDLPNHIASSFVVNNMAAGDAWYLERFTLHWEPLPNILSTMIGLALSPYFDIYTISKILLSIYIIGIAVGYYIFLQIYAPSNLFLLLLPVILTFNEPYTMGFLNYLLSLSIFLLACSCYHLLIHKKFGIISFTLAIILLYLSHIFSYMCFVLFFLIMILHTIVIEKNIANRRTLFRMSIALLILIGGCLAAFTYVVLHNEAQYSGELKELGTSLQKISGILYKIFSMHENGKTWMVLLLFASCLVGPGVQLYKQCTQPALRALPTLPLLGCGLVLLGICVIGPTEVGREANVGSRFLLPAIFMLGAGLPFPAAPRYRQYVVCILVVIFCLKWHDTWKLHAQFAAQAGDLQQHLIARLPPHSRVQAVLSEATDTYSLCFRQFYQYSVIERRAYVPNLFAVPGQQVLRYRIPQQGYGPRQRLSQSDLAGFEYLWVYATQPQAILTEVAGRVELVASSHAHHLYRIRSPA